MFASIYAWVQGRQYSYTPEDWQRCLVAPNKGGVGAEDKTTFVGGAATFAMKSIVFLILSFNGVNAGVLRWSVWVLGGRGVRCSIHSLAAAD